MAILERDLTLMSRAMAYPATPSLVGAVRTRLEAPRTAPVRASRWQLALAGVAAAAVLLAFVVSVAAPAREAVADLFHRINVFETETIPKGLPSEITGDPVTLQEAETRLGQRILLPSEESGLSPVRLLYQKYGRFDGVVLFFQPLAKAPFLILETNAYVGKGLSAEDRATAERVEGLGREAYWITGPHTVEFRDEHGQLIPGSKRLTGENTLVFSRDNFVYRIEGDLSQEEAVKIANSLR